MASRIREALSKASIALSWASHHHLTEDDAKECLEVVDAALAEPVLNCEVGTPEEQYDRFVYCCTSRKMPCRCSYTFGCAECFAKWEQSPYEEGASNANK